MNVQEASKTSVSIVVTPNYKKKQLDSEIMLGSIYEATTENRVKAKAVILAHDPTALDILEILGLEDA